MNDESIKKMAMMIVANCIMNTNITKTTKNANLSKKQLKELQYQMTNKMYTFLTYLLTKPAIEYQSLMQGLTRNFPIDWSEPELDQDFLNMIGH